MDDLAEFEALRERAYAALGNQRHQLGQFYTPAPIARLLASLVAGPATQHVRLLDPGAGVGILAGAAIDRLIELRTTAIELTCCELAKEAIPFLEQGIAVIARRCRAAQVRFHAQIIEDDFVHWAARRCGGQSLLAGDRPCRLAPSERFDVVILNPPYQKIGLATPHRRVLQSLGADCPNLYAGFLDLAARLLAPRGQVVSINPRSFANGPYFRAFRRQFFALVSLHEVHVFTRRDRVFRADRVLQENVMLRAVKTASPRHLTLHASVAGENRRELRRVPMAAAIRPDDPDVVLHLETNAEDARVAGLIAALPATLSDLGLRVSTGRVVDFRTRKALSHVRRSGSVPLLYPAHVRNAEIDWPRRSKKPDHFCPAAVHRALLVPAGVYVLTKRFSSKEEKRRLVAAVISPAAVPGAAYAFENHLNYFHARGQPIKPHLAAGLAAFLNSTVADRYLRTVSGHTQVNATDLRGMRYPARRDLVRIGRTLRSRPPTTANVDPLITALCDALPAAGVPRPPLRGGA